MNPIVPFHRGAIPLPRVIVQIWVLLLAGVAIAFTLDQWAGHDFPTITVLAIFGSFISYIYSAPPLKLKQNGWLGNYALGASYIALPWWAGQALFGDLSLKVIILTLIYSLAGLGIAIVNDFQKRGGRCSARPPVAARHVWGDHCGLDLRLHDRRVSVRDGGLPDEHSREYLRRDSNSAGDSPNHVSRHVLSPRPAGE